MAKPTPTKLVLLMSAAGLTLSWSGLAIASRDDSAASGLALGEASASAHDCQSTHSNQWLSCPVGHGELIRTLVAQTDRLPLPLAAIGSSAEPGQATHAAAVAAPSSRSAQVSSGERARNAMAWVLYDDVDAIAELGAGGAAPAAKAVSATRRTVDAAAAVPGPESAPQAVASLSNDPVTEQVVVAAAPQSLERVLNSLAAVLGADLDAADASTPTAVANTAIPAQEPVAATTFDGERAPVAAASASPAMDPVTQPVAGPSVATAPPPTAGLALAPAPEAGAAAREHDVQRASEASDIVVAASHTDKVLMSLQSLRSADAVATSGERAVKDKPVVVGHSDKVLQTLALFQAKPADRAAHACAKPAGPHAMPVALSTLHSHQTAADEALARLGLELDIDLDLIASQGQPVSDGAGQAQSAPPAPPPHMAAAAAERSEPNALGAELVALRSDQLEEVRGGFVGDGGLKISFGIERAVYLNGTLVTTTSLNIAELSKISGGSAQVTGNIAGSLGLLQSGAGNVFAPGAVSSTAAGTIIQNTLDNQKISTITRIDAVVNSSGILRSMNLQSSMNSAIINSLRR